MRDPSLLGASSRNLEPTFLNTLVQMRQPRLHEREDEVAEAVLGALLPGQFGGHGGLSVQPLCIAGVEGLYTLQAGLKTHDFAAVVQID